MRAVTVCVCLVLSLVVTTYAQGPTLTLEPTEQTVFEYDNAIVRCTPISNVDDNVLHKKVPGGTFILIDPMDDRLSTETDGDTEVFMYNVTREDNGIILRCVLGAFTSTNVSTVTVQYVAVYEEPVVPAQEEGSNLSVVLVVDANPSPDNFTWLKDGEELTMDGRVSFDVTSINITGLIRDDAGIYAVRATNIAGTGPQQSFEVDVLYPPEFGDGFGDDVVCYNNTSDPIECAVRVNSSATLDCTVTGNPQPTVTASTDSGNAAALVNDSISFNVVAYEDAGNYTCIASNGIGSNTTKTFTVQVADVPSILNFSAVLVEPANIVAASWEFVDGGRPIIGFNIDVTRGDVTVISEFEDVNTTQVIISVDHLEVEVYYTLLVAGRNDLGTGEAQSYIFKTNGAAMVSVSMLTLLLMMIASLVL